MNRALDQPLLSNQSRPRELEDYYACEIKVLRGGKEETSEDKAGLAFQQKDRPIARYEFRTTSW
jgi:hypothetical protein